MAEQEVVARLEVPGKGVFELTKISEHEYQLTRDGDEIEGMLLQSGRRPKPAELENFLKSYAEKL
jgi:hypothetical protein